MHFIQPLLGRPGYTIPGILQRICLKYPEIIHEWKKLARLARLARLVKLKPYTRIWSG